MINVLERALVIALFHRSHWQNILLCHTRMTQYYSHCSRSKLLILMISPTHSPTLAFHIYESPLDWLIPSLIHFDTRYRFYQDRRILWYQVLRWSSRIRYRIIYGIDLFQDGQVMFLVVTEPNIPIMSLHVFDNWILATVLSAFNCQYMPIVLLVNARGRILVQVTIYRRLLIGRDGHLCYDLHYSLTKLETLHLSPVVINVNISLAAQYSNFGCLTLSNDT